jgi:hypothetical protein
MGRMSSSVLDEAWMRRVISLGVWMEQAQGLTLGGFARGGVFAYAGLIFSDYSVCRSIAPAHSPSKNEWCMSFHRGTRYKDAGHSAAHILHHTCTMGRMSSKFSLSCPIPKLQYLSLRALVDSRSQCP